jgi:integrase
MQTTLKQYTYVKLGEIKATSVLDHITGTFPLFREFSKEYFITDFTEVSVKVFKDFSSWLTNKWKSGEITASTAYSSSRLIEDVITIGTIKGWKVSNIHIKGMSSKIWHNRVKAEIHQNKRKPIPTFVLDQILYAVKIHETKLVVKSVIIVLCQTGLRISDVLSLKVGCLERDQDSNWILDVWIQKNDQDTNPRVLHKIFVNEWTAQTIKDMENYNVIFRDRLKKTLRHHISQIKRSNLSKSEQDTQIAELRQTDISDYLFIYLPYGDNPETSRVFLLNTKSWTIILKSFMQRWNIVDKDGEIYHLQSHQFRHTFVSDLIRKKVPLAFIRKHLGHVTEDMTNYYVSINDDQAKKELAIKLLHPNAKIAGKRADEIKEQIMPLFRGKNMAQIDEIIEELAGSLSFNLLPTGICIFDEVRGRCTNGDGCFFYNCPNFLTTEENYPVLKHELDECEKWMTRYKEDGKKRDYDRLFIVWEHLRPLVDKLEADTNG